MSERVRVLIADDVDYEDLLAEIQVDGDCVAVIVQDSGDFRIELDKAWVWSQGKKSIPLEEFQKAVEVAKAKLLTMRKP